MMISALVLFVALYLSAWFVNINVRHLKGDKITTPAGVVMFGVVLMCAAWSLFYYLTH